MFDSHFRHKRRQVPLQVASLLYTLVFACSLLPICVPEPAVGSLSSLVPFSCAAAPSPSASFPGTAICYGIESLTLFGAALGPFSV